MPTYINGSPDHWADDMTDTVTVYSASTLDNYGKRSTSATGTTYACHIVSKMNRKRDASGQQKTNEGKLYTVVSNTIAVGDRLVLPDSTEPLVISVSRIKYPTPSGSAVHNTVVEFGWNK